MLRLIKTLVAFLFAMAMMVTIMLGIFLTFVFAVSNIIGTVDVDSVISYLPLVVLISIITTLRGVVRFAHRMGSK